MNFSFDLDLELNEKSPMYLVYPQIFDQGHAVLTVTIEVEDYQAERPAPQMQYTKDYRFYDDGERFEASFKIIAHLSNKQEIPYSLIRPANIVEEIKKYVEQKQEY